MNRKLNHAVTVLLGLALLPAMSQAQRPDSREEAAGAFVQRFYDWYTSSSLANTSKSASELAVENRSSSFSSELLRALKKDIAAQNTSPGEINGLDFDPFSASQDPCERYVVGKVDREADTYRVSIYAICEKKRRQSPDVVAVLNNTHGHWEFINFEYPDRSNLLQILKLLDQQRTKPKR